MSVTPRTLNPEERQAISTLRKSIRSKPWILEELMKDQAHEMAAALLVQAKKELEQLLEANRAFIAAASHLTKQNKES